MSKKIKENNQESQNWLRVHFPIVIDLSLFLYNCNYLGNETFKYKYA